MRIYWNKYDTYIGLYRKPEIHEGFISEKVTTFYLVPIPCIVIEFQTRREF